MNPLKSLSLATLLLILTSGVLNFASALPFTLSVAQAQMVEDRKTAADRLLQQGIEQFQTSQYREALQSWENALTISREIGDRQGEANALGNLGVAYRSLGQYQKAIEYYQQYLAISRD